MNPQTSNPQFLTIEEKRAWLARIFRDTSGTYTDADKFKAMQEDTNLALISQKTADHTMCKTPENPTFAHQKRHKKRQSPTLA